MRSAHEKIRQLIRFAFWTSLISAAIGYVAAIRYSLIDRNSGDHWTMPVLVVALFMSVTMCAWCFAYAIRWRKLRSAFEGDARLFASACIEEGGCVEAETSGKFLAIGWVPRRYVVVMIWILLVDLLLLAFHFRSPQALLNLDWTIR